MPLWTISIQITFRGSVNTVVQLESPPSEQINKSQNVEKKMREKEAKKLKYEVSINKWTGFPIHSWVSDLGLGTTNQRTNVTGFGLWWSTTLAPTLRLCGYTFFSCFFFRGPPTGVDFLTGCHYHFSSFVKVVGEFMTTLLWGKGFRAKADLFHMNGSRVGLSFTLAIIEGFVAWLQFGD